MLEEETFLVRETSELHGDSEETILSGVPIDDKAVDLGLSVLWANCNVGGSPENPIGGLYGWGDPTGRKLTMKFSDYVNLVGGLNIKTPQNISGTDVDIATARWGKDWKMPSRNHWNELIEKCTWTKTRLYNVEGYNIEGPNGKSIFLPITGIRYENEITSRDFGYYWTSEMVEFNNNCAFSFCFDPTQKYHGSIVSNYVYSGQAIRPICEK